MALEYKDSVKDQTTTTGTGTITVGGVAPAGYRTVTSAHTTGATVRYRIYQTDQSEWEIGEGVWTAAGSLLTRVTVYASSNAGSLVSFSAGTKTVITGLVAKDLVDILALIPAAATVATEVPSGTVNGSNTAFTLGHAPTNNEAFISLNGLKQTKTTDYSISGTTLTFVVAPFTGAIVEAFYLYGSVTSIMSATQTTLNLGTTPVYNKVVTASDGAATTTSKIMSWVQAKTTGNADELDMDNLSINANCTTNGTINFFIAANPGPVSGSYLVNYTIG